MRSVALDIETTGLNFLEGHKIVEIGCVELLNNFPSGQKWQRYVNPERTMPEEAFKIHGLSDDFLSDKPKFSDIIESLLDFIKDSELIIHNSRFDLPFINYEIESIKNELINPVKNKIVDTLGLAKKIHPGQSVSLDALRKRYNINIERKNHGALLDAEILAEVFLEMNGGRQQFMNLISNTEKQEIKTELTRQKYSKKIYEITEQEKKSHKELLKFIKN
ncbi:MAG: DNA polymerase III subunit epsilon [Alphaproteobacteria bacterium TMED62]|nr:MAG: DNA polymerase III subunit epsilon [Alphaproteobacteria bacterium TMED62]|tara:strand:- start:14126 stop:14785 length:660 start_codon:yes stop_codon:yes gene_type:complete